MFNIQKDLHIFQCKLKLFMQISSYAYILHSWLFFLFHVVWLLVWCCVGK